MRLSNMRTRSSTKISAYREREERLRSGRAAAQPLRSASPTAALVNVQLRFLPATAPLHAAQSFVLYPGAKAYFSYPCPYGDCDGIYHLDSEANRALTAEKSRVSGTLECVGVRAREGLQRQPCGLRVSYAISAKHRAGELAAQQTAE
jgi:hypothetical protein